MVTQGRTGLDFTSIGGTCTARTYSSGESCTVDLNFTPAYPGLRMGAVVFKDTGGAVLATTYIQGVGVGPLPTVPPASSAAGFSFQPMGVAVDAAGYTYVLDPGTGSGNGALRQLGPGFAGLTLLAGGFNYPVGVAVDGAGNVYVAVSATDSVPGSVWKVTPGGTKTQIAPTTSLDPHGVAVDGDGNLYITDQNTESVLKVAPDGGQSTVADSFDFLVGAIAVDGDGHIYVSDTHNECLPGFCDANNYVWKITPGGARTKVWTGSNQASGVAVDGVGNVYVTDGSLWKVAPGQAQEQVITGVTPLTPRKIAVDGAGSAYIADIVNSQIVKLGGANFFQVIANGACGTANGGSFNPAPSTDLCAADNTASAVAGGGSNPWTWSCTGSNGGTTASCSANVGPWLAFLAAPPAVLSVGGNAGTVVLAIKDSQGSVVSGSSAAVTLTVTGLSGYLGGYSQTYSANAVNGLVNFDLSAVPLPTPDTYTYTASSPGLAPATASEQVAMGQHAHTGVITTIVGTGFAGFSGDGGPAINAQLNFPGGSALDSAGNIYIADMSNSRVRVVCVVSSGAFCNGRTPGNIYTVAGDGGGGWYFGPEGRAATSVSLYNPTSVVVDGAGNLYIFEYHNQMIFKVDAATHALTHFAGVGTWGTAADICSGKTDSVGDGCPATQAFLFPGNNGSYVGMAMGATGDMYISAAGLVRVISGGIIRTLAGCATGSEANWCSGPDSIQYYANAVAVDRGGYVYFANNTSGNVVYKLDPATGSYSLVAGARSGASSYCNGAETDYFGDGCPAVGDRLYAATLATDSSNNLYWSESYGNGGDRTGYSLVRSASATTNIVTAVAGITGNMVPNSVNTTPVCSGATNDIGDGCPATSARLNTGIGGVMLDAFDNIYIASYDRYVGRDGGHRVRKVTTWLLTPTLTKSASQTIEGGTTSIALSGTIAAGMVHPHDNETMTITINSVSMSAPIIGGSFAATFDTTTLPISATPYAITYTYAGDEAIGSVSDSSTTLTVKAPLIPMTIKADNQTMIYGSVMPPLTYMVSPNVTLDTAPTCVPPVTYPGAITCSGAASDGYKITYVDGLLTVLPATPAFSNLTASQTILYGTPTITLSGTIAAVGATPPSSETVSITINNVSTAAQIGANGSFSATVDMHTQPASHLGCFADSEPRALETQSFNLSTNSVETCSAACSLGGFKYAGVEDGGECWCGNNEDYGRLGTSSSCVTSCSGNAAETCGGPWALNIYRVAGDLLPVSATPYTIAYAYAGDSYFAPAVDTNTTVTVTLNLAISAPATTPVTPFNFTVIAQDVNNNTVTSYSGLMHFSSSDSNAVLPADAALTNGVGTFAATLRTIGNQTISASDTANSRIAGSSNVILVNAPVAPTVTFDGAPDSAPYKSTFPVSATTNASTSAVITASGSCTIAGTTVTITKSTGMCTLKAAWVADAPFYLAATATQSTTATGIPPYLSVAGLAFGNAGVGATTAPKTVYLYNYSGATITPGIPDRVTAFATSPGTCGVPLATNKSCSFTVTFAPTDTLTYSPTLDVDTGVGTLSLALTGTGIQPFSLSPATLAFGNKGVGETSAPKTLTFHNYSGGPITPTIPATVEAFSTSPGTCGTPVATGKFCTFTVTFAPTVVGGYSSQLTVTAGTMSLNVTLTGAGIVPFLLSPTKLAFGTLGLNVPSAPKTVTLTNRSGGPITPTIPIPQDGFAAVGLDGCASLPDTKSCTFTVTFTPTAANAYSGTLNVDPGTGAQALPVAVTGTGIQPFYLSPITLAFGTLGAGETSAAKTVTLHNYSGGPIAPTIPNPPDGYVIAGLDNCVGLPNAKTCTFTVTFTPTAATSYSNSLTVNAVTKPPLSAALALTGTGIASFSLSPTTLAFGIVTAGHTSAAKTVTLTNRSGGPITPTTPVIPAGYAVANLDNCAGVADKKYCTFTVTFTPTGKGATPGTLNVDPGTGAPVQSLSLTGTGK